MILLVLLSVKFLNVPCLATRSDLNQQSRAQPPGVQLPAMMLIAHSATALLPWQARRWLGPPELIIRLRQYEPSLLNCRWLKFHQDNLCCHVLNPRRNTCQAPTCLHAHQHASLRLPSCVQPKGYQRKRALVSIHLQLTPEQSWIWERLNKTRGLRQMGIKGRGAQEERKDSEQD